MKERLAELEELEGDLDKLEDRATILQAHPRRQVDSPVQSSAKLFKLKEVVDLKGHLFECTSCKKGRIIFKPHKPTLPIGSNR